MLRLSSLFVRTLRENPSDAEVPSHQLMVRAGYIRRAAPGGYTWLPLGWNVYRNVERIVREEMDAAGFQEVHFPALLPREPYEATNRWTEYGPNLFRLQDRRGVDYLLGPTHEEMFTLLVKDLYSSYKDLPLSIYQIQTKFRDEARPRAGLLRGREFVMKDSYSFDIDDAGLAASYEAHRAAYIKTFERLHLPFVIVSAMSGAMGGSKSEEFLAPLEVGEDTFVRCTTCGYAANTEAVTVPTPAAIDFSQAAPSQVVDTPNTPTIATLVDLLNARTDINGALGKTTPWTSSDTLKNVIIMLRHPDGRREPLAIGLPGDREVDMKRVEAQVGPAEPDAFTEADFANYPALVKGYIGPEVLGAKSASQILFGKTTSAALQQLDSKTFLEIFEGVPQAQIDRTEILEGMPIIAALAGATQFLASNGEARRAIKENAIAVNKTKVDENYQLEEKDLIANQYILLQGDICRSELLIEIEGVSNA